ncbi:MAG: hemin-degrading factor [Aureispira sp.]
METTTLKEQYSAYKAAHPKARIRTIAQVLAVSEMELLEIAGYEQCVYLGDQYEAVLKEVHELGKVMALTRNEHAVHEVKGIYDNVQFMGKAPMGLAHNELIDTRYFTSTWAHVYAVVFQSGKRTMHSLQIFDKYGQAVHKIYLTPASKEEAYYQLVQKFQQKARLPFALEKAPILELASFEELPEIDLPAFQQAWLELKDTHDFFGLLRKYSLTRQQAFRLAPEGSTYQVEKESLVAMLEAVAANQTPIMVFLGNKACLQIYSGTVKKLMSMDNWYNILDPNFNLHVQLDRIEEVWVVKKNTADGIVTSLELFDEYGNQILYCFGKRKPGIPELSAWREVVANLSVLEA